MYLPYPLPSHHPACGCQEDRSLTVPIPHAFACFCTLSGPLFIQAPRFTRWYGWFHLLFRGKQLHIQSDIVSQQWDCPSAASSDVRCRGRVVRLFSIFLISWFIGEVFEVSFTFKILVRLL